MSDLVSGLLAKLDEEEAGANRMGHTSPDDGGFYSCPAVHTEQYGDLPWGEDACECRLKQRQESVLRLCRAHRDIIEEFSRCGPSTQGYSGLRYAVECLARGWGVEE